MILRFQHRAVPNGQNFRALPRSNVCSAVARTELCADVFILRHGARPAARRRVNTLDNPGALFSEASAFRI